MTTTNQAYSALRARLEASPDLPPLRFSNEDQDSAGNTELPATPAPFLYTELETNLGELVSFGGGLGANRYRTRGWLDVYVYVPKGWGISHCLDYAETAAALFRSYRDDLVNCFAATVVPGGDGSAFKPPGLPADVSNYFWATTEVELFFDTIG